MLFRSESSATKTLEGEMTAAAGAAGAAAAAELFLESAEAVVVASNNRYKFLRCLAKVAVQMSA